MPADEVSELFNDKLAKGYVFTSLRPSLTELAKNAHRHFNPPAKGLKHNFIE